MQDTSDPVILKAGAVLFESGAIGHAADLILSGRVAVFRRDADGETVLARRGPGEILGEMAIVDALPRSAGVRAEEDCVLVPVSAAQIRERLAGADPILRLCLEGLIARLRETLPRLGPTEDGGRAVVAGRPGRFRRGGRRSRPGACPAAGAGAGRVRAGPAADRAARHRTARGFRGADPLARSRAGARAAGRLHPGRGGERPDRRRHRLGDRRARTDRARAPSGGPRCARLRRGFPVRELQRHGPGSRPVGPPGPHRRDAAPDRPRAGSPEARDHREHADAGSGRRRRRPGTLPRVRPRHRGGRFRDRLFLAQPPQHPADHHAQGRPGLRAGDAGGDAGPPDRPDHPAARGGDRGDGGG
jgi:hypothetical protein